MSRTAWLIALYVVAGIAALAIANSDQNDVPYTYALVTAASVAVGWGTGSFATAAVAVVLIPLALPFGDSNRFSGGDDTDPVALLAGIAAVWSVLLILVTAAARKLYERKLSRRGSS